LRFDIFRPPWILWRAHDGACEITIELRHASPVVCAVAVLIAHLAGANRITWALFAGVLTVALVSGAWAWQMAHHVRARRRLQARWVQVGDVMEEQFTLRNASPLPVLWAEVADQSDVPGYQANVVRAVGGSDQLTWTHSGTAARRGEFHLGPWSVETGDPLGILAVRLQYTQARPLLVYPPLTDLPFPPLPRGASPGASRIRLAATTPTSNAGQVRAYEWGDSFRHIHWPTTARRDELMVKMFDQEASADVWLMMDTDPAVQSGDGDAATEEVAVLVAASLAADLLRAGRAVGLLTFALERRLVRPARSTHHLWTLLGELARLPNANQRERIGQSLASSLHQIARLLRSGSNVVIITSSGDPAWISDLAQLAGRQIVPSVILIDPAPGGRPRASRMESLLAEQGVICRTVRCDVPLPIRPALGKTRRWEFKTLATGRVVKTMESVR
jgi:uncharacterized protein (DUF58 family)